MAQRVAKINHEAIIIGWGLRDSFEIVDEFYHDVIRKKACRISIMVARYTSVRFYDECPGFERTFRSYRFASHGTTYTAH